MSDQPLVPMPAHVVVGRFGEGLNELICETFGEGARFALFVFPKSNQNLLYSGTVDAAAVREHIAAFLNEASKETKNEAVP